LVCAVMLTVGLAGAFNKIVVIAEQPLAVVAVMVYVIPAHKLLLTPVLLLIVPEGAIVYTAPGMAVGVAVPLQPGTQLGWVDDTMFTGVGTGAVKFTVVCPVQPFTSVAVMVYVTPAHKLLAAPVLALIVAAGEILYVNPACGFGVAVPSQPGTQLGVVVLASVTTGEPGVVNNTVEIAVQFDALATVIVYVIPAHKFDAIPVEVLIVPDGAILYKPPATADDVAPPSQPGKQLGGVVDVIESVGEAGTVNNTVAVAVHPLALVTVTV
jgi:hypothetical protein